MLLAAFPTPLGRDFSDFFTPLRSRPVNMAKRVCRDCPIPSCGVKYLVKLSNHLTYVHELDYINRRKCLQEAKLQFKVPITPKYYFA